MTKRRIGTNEGKKDKGQEARETNNDKRDLLSLVISFVALVLSFISLIYGRINDKKTSYFEPFNYHIEVDSEGYVPNYTHNDGGIQIHGPTFKIKCDSGSFKNVTVILCADERLHSVLQVDFLDSIDREKHEASANEAEIPDIELYPIRRSEASEESKSMGYKESYYSTVYILVEDFNREYCVTPISFEFPINEDETLSKEVGYRVYNAIDLLYASKAGIPDYVKPVLTDYRYVIDALELVGIEASSN